MNGTFVPFKDFFESHAVLVPDPTGYEAPPAMAHGAGHPRRVA